MYISRAVGMYSAVLLKVSVSCVTEVGHTFERETPFPCLSPEPTQGRIPGHVDRIIPRVRVDLVIYCRFLAWRSRAKQDADGRSAEDSDLSRAWRAVSILRVVIGWRVVQSKR